MIKTMIFTTTDIVKKARKIAREEQELWGIDKMSQKEFRQFSEMLSETNNKIFNLVKNCRQPEREYLLLTQSTVFCNNEIDKTQTAILNLLGFAAKSIIIQRVEELSDILATPSEIGKSELTEWWRSYEEVRQGGDYNMITEAEFAANEAELTIEQYKFVMANYNSLKAATIIADALNEPSPF